MELKQRKDIKTRALIYLALVIGAINVIIFMANLGEIPDLSYLLILVLFSGRLFSEIFALMEKKKTFGFISGYLFGFFAWCFMAFFHKY